LNCNRITTWNDQSLGFCWSYEGDGCFSTGNRLRITFHLKDRYLANELKKSIGFGNIQKPYNRLLIYSLIPSKWTTTYYCVNQREICRTFKINQLLKYGYEEKLEVKILPPTKIQRVLKCLACRFFED
jgi:hypothetical protein